MEDEKKPEPTITVTPPAETPINEDGSDESEDPGDDGQLTKLEYSYSFWFSYDKENKAKQVEDYENQLRKVGDFHTAEDFWGFYQHIRRPDSLPKGCEFFLFKSGVKPAWEHPDNKGGGRFVLHIKKLFANKTWEDMLIALITSTKTESDINGVVINVRSWEILLSVWTKKLVGEEIVEKYRTWLQKSLGMTEKIKIEYKQHPNPDEVKPRETQRHHDDGDHPDDEKEGGHLNKPRERWQSGQSSKDQQGGWQKAGGTGAGGQGQSSGGYQKSGGYSGKPSNGGNTQVRSQQASFSSSSSYNKRGGQSNDGYQSNSRK